MIGDIMYNWLHNASIKAGLNVEANSGLTV